MIVLKRPVRYARLATRDRVNFRGGIPSDFDGSYGLVVVPLEVRAASVLRAVRKTGKAVKTPNSE